MLNINKANKLFKSGNYKAAIKGYTDIILHHPELENILRENIVLAKKRRDAKEKLVIKKDIELIEEILSRQPKKIQVNYNIYLDAVEDFRSEIYNSKTLIAVLHCLEASPFQINLIKIVFEILIKLNLHELLSPYHNTPSFNLGTLIKLATDQDYWITYRNLIKNKIIKHGFYCQNSIKLVSEDPKGTIKVNNNIKILNSEKKGISIGTILLNEQKFIGANLCNHYHLCDEWIIVEGACNGYPKRKVSISGVSLDNTEKIIKLFPDPDGKITYIQHGWTEASGENAKSELRNVYIKRSIGTYLVVIDADEFYEKEDFEKAINKLKSDKNIYSIVLPQVHFWKATDKFITGEYYDVSHTRFFRNLPGMKYIRNHNFPELNGKFIHELGQFKYQRNIIASKTEFEGYTYEGPRCYHMGFVKDVNDMQDKTQYYINRGEDVSRVSTTMSRSAWFDGIIPEKCIIRRWCGKLPEFINYEERVK